ncbi:PilZ domain-containing protein [Thiotrichales bacterium HSG1]|nr:PilZ domain-containing protein [Thiotrichales bacterium HSG1]
MNNFKKIEEFLNRHPDVQKVAVVEHKPDVLVAYIVSGLIPDRLPFHGTCLLEHAQEKITVYTEDISYNGFCVVGVHTMKENDTVHLHIRLPGDDKETYFNGKVVWYRKAKAGIQLFLNVDEQKNIEQGVNYIINNHGFLKVLQRVITGRLHKYLLKMLPNENIPSIFLVIRSLPIKDDGQIDVKALPEPGNNFW